jgi:hypothetical protein
MARQKAIAIENNFTQGFFTEATGLKFPENTCTEMDNCRFKVPGILSRRYGFDLEDRYTETTIDVNGNVVVSYRWDNVAGDGDIVFIVTQVGDTLRFYRVSGDSPLSNGLHATTIALSTFFTTGTTTVKTLECQFSSGNGLLFVTNPWLETFYVEYTPASNTLAATQVTLQVRDFEGDTADSETITSRPTSTLAGLNAHHRYNLENQGWVTTTLTSWDTAQTTMPSNADVPWYYKSTTNAFDFSLINNYALGNTKAPGGHFIYSLYNTNRSTNVSGATDSSIPQERVSHSAFYAGRVWYSGLSAPGKASSIYFSQIVQQKAQYGFCYQNNDPTSEFAADLLPDDGGFIDIIDAGSIIKMGPVFNNLLVVCTNGVWAISGSQGIGFTANDYSVRKISGIHSSSSSSFVWAEGQPYWWTLDGIYTVTQDPQTNSLQIVSITDTTIKKFYQNTIITETKQYARGAYDPFTRTLIWLYRSTEASNFNDRYVFDRTLTLNLTYKAYSPWSMGATIVRVHSIVDIFGLSGTFVQSTVTSSAGADTVTANAGADTVIAFIASSGQSSTAIKYLVSHTVSSNNKMTWGETRNTAYVDWISHNAVGENFISYAVTAYRIRGEGIRKFQSNYIRVYTDNATNSVFDLQGRWDFAITGDSGKWTNVQRQTIIMDSSSIYNNRTKRLKLRGHGLVMQLKFSSATGQPFDIIGWVTFDTANEGI